MSLGRWLTLVGAVMVVGMSQVAQRNALYFQGYALGESAQRLHTKDVELGWLNAQVMRLASPVHLADFAREQRMKFVAWATIPSNRPSQSSSLMHIAAVVPSSSHVSDDAAD